MKKKNILTISIITIVLFVSWVVLFKSASAPTIQKKELYIGLSLEQWQQLAIKNWITLRAVTIDGDPQPMTRDYRIGRLNATIVDGLITWYSIEWEKTQLEPKKIPENNQVSSDLYIWLNLEDAKALAVENNTTLRASIIDWEPQMMTMDYVPGRINATIVDWVVSSYSIEWDNN